MFIVSGAHSSSGFLGFRVQGFRVLPHKVFFLKKKNQRKVGAKIDLFSGRERGFRLKVAEISESVAK